MKKWRWYLSFNRQERRGVFFLLSCILLLQLVYTCLLLIPPEQGGGSFTQVHEPVDDDPDNDSLYLHPFNPNYIDDFKGYVLGIPTKALDNIYEHREQGGYVKSLQELGQVAGLDDSTLNGLAPYLRFPPGASSGQKKYGRHPAVTAADRPGAKVVAVADLNTVGQESLMEVRGIGPVLSRRILKFREALGGFLVDEQLMDVYGLQAEVAARVLERYRVLQAPEVEKIPLNAATAGQLSRLVYISFPLAEAIVRRREELGHIASFDEISQLEGFPADKIDRIKLYLSL